MSKYFRFERNGGILDVVKDGHYWYRSAIYPARLESCLGPDPIPFPEQRGTAWADCKALRKSLILQGWKYKSHRRDCTKYETGNRTTKRTVKSEKDHH